MAQIAPPALSTTQVTTGKEVEPSTKPKIEPTRGQVIRARVQLITLCGTLFLAGWNDGSLGPLLPRIQQVYHVGYTIVSLLFVFQCVGCLGGAFVNIVLTEKQGFGRAAALPFPVFVLSCVINGVGLAIQDAQANGYVASLADNSETKMGFVQAAYGAGALVAPLVSTQFAQLHHWSFHYIVSVGITAFNTVFLTMVFRAKSQDDCLAQIGQAQGEKGKSEESHLRQIISIKSVHLLAVFLLVYVGVEVTIGGWIVTFMINVRGGGASAGYICGILWRNHKIGERRVVYIYGLLAISFELVIWLVPSLIGGAISVSIIGLLLGPIYPIAMNHAGRIFPPWLLTGSIGWIAGIATAGAAVVPFITGAIASRTGIKSLEPVLVGMLGLMMVLWAAVPSDRL
ncbi:MFS general substrate transporter [Mycena rebaudengoi]|nr:MFS general substrate transporter [Mycena rebaudengoi]